MKELLDLSSLISLILFFVGASKNNQTFILVSMIMIIISIILSFVVAIIENIIGDDGDSLIGAWVLLIISFLLVGGAFGLTFGFKNPIFNFLNISFTIKGYIIVSLFIYTAVEKLIQIPLSIIGIFLD